MKDFATDRIDPSQPAGCVLNENFDVLTLVDQTRRAKQRQFDRVYAEVETTGVLPVP